MEGGWVEGWGDSVVCAVVFIRAWEIETHVTRTLEMAGPASG